MPYVSQPNQHRVMKGITCKSKPLFLTHFPKSNSLHCFLGGEGEGPPPPRADAYRSRALSLSLSHLSSDFRAPALPPMNAAAAQSRYPSLAPRHFRFCRGGGGGLFSFWASWVRFGFGGVRLCECFHLWFCVISLGRAVRLQFRGKRTSECNEGDS